MLFKCSDGLASVTSASSFAPKINFLFLLLHLTSLFFGFFLTAIEADR